MADDNSGASPGATPELDTTVDATPPPPPAPDSGTVTDLTGNDVDDATTDGAVVSFSMTRTQRDLAFRLVWVMIGIVAVVAVLSVTYSVSCWVNPGKDLTQPCGSASAALTLLTNSLSPMFTAMVGLVGSVVGFYFGSKQGSG